MESFIPDNKEFSEIMIVDTVHEYLMGIESREGQML